MSSNKAKALDQLVGEVRVILGTDLSPEQEQAFRDLFERFGDKLIENMRNNDVEREPTAGGIPFSLFAKM